MGYSPWGHKELDTTERLHLHQYSCLENPMDRGTWKATIHGVAESQTQLSTTTGGEKNLRCKNVKRILLQTEAAEIGRQPQS